MHFVLRLFAWLFVPQIPPGGGGTLAALFLIPLISFSLLPPIKDSNAAETQITANVSYGIYSLTIEASPTVAMSIATDPVGTMSVVSTSVKTTTTAPNGYKLYLGMTGSTNDLVNTTNNTLRIPSTSGTLTSPTALSAEGTWGYALSSTASKVITPNGFDTTYTVGSSFTPNNNKFASVPVSTKSPQLIASSNAPSAANGDTLNVYYGVSANYNVPNGTYSNTVAYTAIADSGAGHNLYLSPTSTTNVNGGEPLTLSTTLYATTSDTNNPLTSNIPADIYLLTASELANVHNGTPASLYNAKKLTCSRITTAQTLSFDCTTIAAAKGSYYIYVDVPTYGVSYEAPFLITEPSGFFTLTTMQQMATYPEYCTSATTPSTTAQYEDTDGTHIGDTNYVPTLTLVDTRDGERYRIRKLADGNCWMTENLRLELTENQVLTPDDTDVAVNTTVGMTTQPWDQPNGGNYYDWGTLGSGGTQTEANTDRWLSRSTKVNGAWATETTPTVGGAPTTNLTGDDQKTGIYYNWYTATAGTGNWDIALGVDAQSSICPAGWELPRYSNVNGTSTLAPSASWMGLIRDTYHIITTQGSQSSSAVTKLYAFPLSLLLSGVVSGEYGVTNGQGVNGYFWSAGAFSQKDGQYFQFSVDVPAINPEQHYTRLSGFPVRCVAKTFWSISQMQQMTPEIAASATTPATDAPAPDTDGSHQGEDSYVPQRILTDIRDGEAYRVRKLADGNVWMTENLRKEFTAGEVLTPATTDVATNTTVDLATQPYNQPKTGTTDGVSWDYYNWGIGDDSSNLTEQAANRWLSRSTKVNGVWATETTPSQSVPDNRKQNRTGEDQKYGVYYNFYAATAGSGSYNVTQKVTDHSICPSNWGIPVLEGEKSFYNLLVSTYNIMTSKLATSTGIGSKLFAFPFSYALSGTVMWSTGGTGDQGYATRLIIAYARTNTAHGRFLIEENDLDMEYNNARTYGMVVRCVTK